MVAAIDAGIPMVAVSVVGKGYDYAAAVNFFMYLDSELEKANPGACDLLQRNGVEPIACAHKLSSIVPNLIRWLF